MQFEDITSSFGIDQEGDSWGVAWGDVNGDGFPELWVNQHQAFGKLYLNQGGLVFTDVTNLYFSNFRRTSDLHGALWLDVDNDGDDDLLQLAGGGSGRFEVPKPGHYERLYINESGQLIERTENFFGIEYGLARGRTPLTLDVNQDGKLDIFVSAQPHPNGSYPSTIFQQTEDGFINIGDLIGLSPNVPTRNFAVLGDVNGDRIPEFIMPTTEAQPLKIYDTTTLPFEDISEQYLPDITLNPFIKDVVVADFDGDLRQDLFLLGASRSHTLLLNQGDHFVSADLSDSLQNMGQGKNVAHGDWDNDGDIDLFVVRSGNGRADGSLTNSPDYLFLNQGNGNFERVLSPGVVQGTNLGIGDSASVVDVDADGFLDLFVTNGDLSGQAKENYNTAPYQLFRNKGNENHWLEIDLMGVASNPDAIGATVILTTEDGQQQLRAQNGGIHNRTQNFTRLHFGLADQTVISQIEVFWPSGASQIFTDILVDQVIGLQEDQNEIISIFPPVVEPDFIEIPGTVNNDRLIGSQKDELILGIEGNDTLKGQGGVDTLVGGIGNDRLVGGANADVLEGGEGADKFIFVTKSQGGDEILDFDPAMDEIWISAKNFDSNLQKGLLSQAQLSLGTTVNSEQNRFSFDEASGELRFDSDGNGVKPSTLVATISNLPNNFAARNIRII